MTIANMPILSALRTKMQWHQERQRLLAENVANADTANFKPRDLAPLKPEAATASASSMLTLTRTSSAHLAVGGGAGTQFNPARNEHLEVRPAGNAVDLEDEMMKVAANQMDYQAATTLYSRSLGLLKTAIGKR